MNELHPTPGQTIGPFFGYALPYDDGPYLVRPGTPGAVQLTGRVLDAAGMPVPDALVEIWQPDAAGAIVSRSGSLRRDGHTFTGFGRAASDNAGRYSFTTVRPGPTAPGQAPFFAVTIFARGLLDRLLTRLYLPVEDAVLAADPLLSSLPKDRRSTVIAQESDGVLHWDIRLSGPQETVFPGAFDAVVTDLLVAGSGDAEGVFDTASLLGDLLSVEEAWSAVLAAHGLAPDSAVLAAGSLTAMLTDADSVEVARAAEESGNPVVPLVALLRNRLTVQGRTDAARFLHRGLTSQDTIDTALVLGLRRAGLRVRAELARQSESLRDLAVGHRDTVQTARTLTQPAVPTTFGLVVAGWLGAVLDLDAELARAIERIPVQVGGAGGTLSAIAEMARAERDSAGIALAAAADLGRRLSLAAAPPWHTHRRPMTALADVLVACTDSWSVISGYVLTRSRPEIGELREGTPGGSSTMPHKANPVLSTLIRRAALTCPAQLGLLHTAAALGEDERSAGPWHSEWPALRTIARTVVIAAAQTTRLLASLVVDADQMHANAEGFTDDLLAEQSSIRGLVSAPKSGADVSGYLGAAGRLVDAAVARPLPTELEAST